MAQQSHRKLESPIPLRFGWRQKPWAKLDSYVFSEIKGPFFAAMLVYNGIFFIQILAKATELTSGKFEIPTKLLLLFFFSQIPDVLMKTTAMSFLFASLAAITRMSSDSEIIAPQSLGIGFWRISRPVILFGGICGILLSLTSHWVGPALNKYWITSYQAYASDLPMPNIQAGVISSFGKDLVLYVDRVEKGFLTDLWLYDQSNQQEQIVLANQASLYSNRTLELFNAVKIDIDGNNQKGPSVLRMSKLEQTIGVTDSLNASASLENPEKTLNSAELWQLALETKEEKRHIELVMAFWDRVIPPLVCIIFSLYAVPMAARHSRLGKGTGFGLSLLLIAIYFWMNKVGSDYGMERKIPLSIGIGLPPALFLLLGVLMQVGKSLWWRNPFTWLKEQIETQLIRFFRKLRELWHSRKTEEKPQELAIRPPSTWVFPSKLDTYVFKSFVSFYFLVQGSLLMMALLIEYSQVSRFVQRFNPPTEVVIKYLLFKIPEFINFTLFISLLIATLVVLANLSKNQEVTAVQAAGGHLQRLCLPLVMCGIGASFFSFYVGNSFIPYSNRMATGLSNVIRNKQEAIATQDQWLRNTDGLIVNYKFFDPVEKRLLGLRMFSMDSESDGFLTRTFVPSLLYDGKNWRAEKPGQVWRFERVADVNKLKAIPLIIKEGDPVQVSLAWEDLSRKRRRASEFSIPQLNEYIQYLRILGVNDNEMRTEYFAKFAQPLLPFFMMLIAMPLGFQFGRRGTFYGTAIGLVLGMVFWGLFEMVKTFGASGVLHPLVASWSVLTTFGFISLYRFILLE